MRSPLEIGALAFINSNFIHIKEHLNQIDLASTAGLVQFAKDYSLCRKELTELGLLIKEGGVSSNIRHRYISLSATTKDRTPVVLQLLPKVAPDWGARDGTIAAFQASTTCPTFKLPRSSNHHTCVDTMIAIGRMLQLGRCQIDQCYPKDLALQNKPSLTLRGILLGDWTQSSQQELDLLADELVRELNSYCGKTFPDASESPWNMVDVFTTCAVGFPQCTWAGSDSYQCDQELVRLDADVFPEPKTSIMISVADLAWKQTLQSHLHELSTPAPGNTYACISGKPTHECDGRHYFPHVYIDRPPPTLTLTFSPLDRVDASESINREMFKDLNLRVQTLQGLFQMSYLPVGAVFRLKCGSVVSRWITPTLHSVSLTHLQTNIDSSSSIVPDWWSELGAKGAHLLMIFFRRADGPSTIKGCSRDRTLFDTYTHKFQDSGDSEEEELDSESQDNDNACPRSTAGGQCG